ncbi:MAG: hypothetical protein NZ562_12690 [Thermomicrobium sp.]|nr:hypothetical protein [Thermomicrobium sp.]
MGRGDRSGLSTGDLREHPVRSPGRRADCSQGSDGETRHQEGRKPLGHGAVATLGIGCRIGLRDDTLGTAEAGHLGDDLGRVAAPDDVTATPLAQRSIERMQRGEQVRVPAGAPRRAVEQPGIEDE